MIDSFLGKVNTNILTSKERDSLERQITINKCLAGLKTFQKNKTPGNDGLTVEFYIAFWPIIGTCLVNCLNFAHSHGQLLSGNYHFIRKEG